MTTIRFLLFIILFAFVCGVHAQTAVKKAEYFFDTDPYFGNGKSIAIPSNTGDVNITFSADISSLPEGLHTLGIRSYNDSGWSISNNFIFLKQIAQQPKAKLISGEYFFDTKTEFGKSMASFSIPTGASDYTLVLNAAGVDTLKEGFHVLSLRTKDENNLWSITNNWLFYKQVAIAKPNLLKAEYFIDTDPGFGKGKSFGLNSSVNIIDQANDLNISDIDTTSLHYFYLRTYDENGNWSITNWDTFHHTGAVLPLNWIRFTTVQQDDNALLTWVTANESNTKNFDIEHSVDGIHWDLVNTISAKGQTQNTYSYLFSDLNAGNNFFRIRQWDQNGSFSVSNINMLFYLLNKKNNLIVFPNPLLGNRIKISSDLFTKEKTTITLIGSNGVHYQLQHFEKQNTSSVTFSLNRFVAKGLYYIVVESATSKQYKSLLIQ